MRKYLTEALNKGLIMGMSAALLWHFYQIWTQGKFYIQEPNIVILTLETIMLAGIFIYAVVSLGKNISKK